MAVAEAEMAEINLPEWTEHRKKNGLDPLSMQNNSISLSQMFLGRLIPKRHFFNGLIPMAFEKRQINV